MQDVSSRLVWLTIAAVFWALQLLYLVMPIDLLPDLVPLIGWTDDLIVVLAGLGTTAYGFWRAWPEDTTPRLAAETLDYEPISADDIRSM